jgi:hypothetical protein
MEFSTCPSCGFPTLEMVEVDSFEADEFLSPQANQSIAMFECMSCRWVGSTSTVNMV